MMRFVCWATGHSLGAILTLKGSDDVFLRLLMPSGGLIGEGSPLRGQISQHPNFVSVNRHFQAKRAKYENFHIIETTASIPTKFC